MTIDIAPRLFVHGRGPNSAGTYDRVGQPFTGVADALTTLTHEKHAHAARTKYPHHEWVWTAKLGFQFLQRRGRPCSHDQVLGTLSSKGHTTFENGFENRYICKVDRFTWFSNNGPDKVGLFFDDLPDMECPRGVYKAFHAGTRMAWLDLQTGELEQFDVQLTGLIDIRDLDGQRPRRRP